jgi:16S rRNA (cytosine967-C5)-methyltransferase
MISPARLAAFDILLRVEQEQAYAAELLHSTRLERLSPADRALCTEIVMGVLRWRSRLDADIAQLSFTPFRKLDLEVLTSLRIGAYQMQFLDRVPARAAINESVELVKHAGKTSASSLTNAVLRKLNGAVRRRSPVIGQVPESGNVDGRESPTSATAFEGRRLQPARTKQNRKQALAPEALVSEFAHPQWLVDRWIANYGDEAAAAICAYDQQVPPTSIRIPTGADAASLEAELGVDGVALAPGALLASARRVVTGDVVRTAAFRDGRIRILDEGSQLVAALVGRGRRLLDCCAAPGGKTAALADRNPEAQVVAVDLHPHRARLLRELLRDSRVTVLAADARSLPLAADFDRVLVDVPCSGTGTLGRNPEIKWRLKPGDLADLHQRQVAILRGALEKLAPGGQLVYSTCSLEPEECEAVVEEVAGETRLLPVRDELQKLSDAGELAWPDVDSLVSRNYLRTLPGVHPCDGFFVAILAR